MMAVMAKTYQIRYFFTCPLCQTKNEGEGEFVAENNWEARDRALESVRCSSCKHELPPGHHCMTTINEKK